MWGLRLWHDVGIALPEAKATSTSYWTAAKDKPRSGGERGYVSGHDQRGEGPDPRNQPLGRGVTVTDWRLYTADHRHIDGGGNQTTQEKPRGLRGALGSRAEWAMRPDPRNVSHRPAAPMRREGGRYAACASWSRDQCPAFRRCIGQPRLACAIPGDGAYGFPRSWRCSRSARICRSVFRCMPRSIRRRLVRGR